MANLIILEGLSRTGKSTISTTLAKKQGFRSISIKNKMPDFVENLHDFYHGIHTLSNVLYSEYPNDTFVLDRSFLSELVYSEFFNRKSLIEMDDSIPKLLENNFMLVYLSNSYQRYIQRGPKDKIIYSESDFDMQKRAFDYHFKSYQEKYEEKRFLEIDTVETSIEDSIKLIMSRYDDLKK